MCGDKLEAREYISVDVKDVVCLVVGLEQFFVEGVLVVLYD